jgi:hypothetical protein
LDHPCGCLTAGVPSGVGALLFVCGAPMSILTLQPAAPLAADGAALAHVLQA